MTKIISPKESNHSMTILNKIPKEYRALAEKYPYIVAWGMMMQSYGYYIAGELQAAEKTHAPSDAIYMNHEKDSWSTPHNDLKKELDAYLNGTKGGVIINW
jgi:hypothetical protein